MDLFQYSDYREYLRDFYGSEKRKNPSYSFRVFARKAGLRSPNYLKLVIDSDRKITEKNLPLFLQGLRLNRKEAQYFQTLVRYQETRDPELKSSLLQELLRLRVQSARKVKTLERARYELLKSWHHWAIREMVNLKNFKADPSWIAKTLKNKITPEQAKESLKILQRLEFIKKQEGRFVQSEPLISTSDEISSLFVKNLHRQFIELGIQSLFSDPVSEREFGGLSIAIPKSQLPKMKTMIKEFRRDLNQLFTTEDEGEEVYHLNMLFYPLTKNEGETS